MTTDKTGNSFNSLPGNPPQRDMSIQRTEDEAERTQRCINELAAYKAERQAKKDAEKAAEKAAQEAPKTEESDNQLTLEINIVVNVRFNQP
jgi:hypothetical protein